MIPLNSRSVQLVWETVEYEIKHWICSGALKEGEALPSVAELSSRMAINPQFVRYAYQKLTDDGYVAYETLKGKKQLVVKNVNGNIRRENRD